MKILTSVFLCLLAAASIEDIRRREIRDGISAAIAVLSALSLSAAQTPGPAARLAGALCVSAPMLVITLARPGAFGGGDIKLTAAGGLFLGWQLMLVSAVIAMLSGGVFAVCLCLAGKADRRTRFAFGPFLCFGMAAAVFWGEELIRWYAGGIPA